MPAITLNQLAIALLGASAYVYRCAGRGGYWKAVSSFGGQRIERDHPSPYAALAAVAAVQLAYEAAQTSQDYSDDPAARAAYRAAWAATAGQPLAARFAATEAAATEAAATEAAATEAAATKAATGPAEGPAADDEPEACYRHEMALAYWQARWQD